MGTVEVALLSYQDVVALDVGMGAVIDLVERAFRELGDGGVENPPKPGIHARPDTFIHAMPAYFRKLDIGGLKWVAGYPGNRDRGLPQILGMIVLNDMDTGVPVCVMDGTWITAVRTAAVSAVTAKFCAPPGAARVGIIGAGVQGHYNALALREVLPDLAEVAVYDIRPSAAAALAERLTRELGVATVCCGEPRQAVAGSQVVVTATQRLERPVVHWEWVAAGCLGLPLEIGRAWDAAAFAGADRFVTDDWGQARYFQEQGGFPNGFPAAGVELGSVVSGRAPGRLGREERVLAVNTGLAMSDVIVADHVYRRSRAAGPVNTFTLWSEA